MSKRCLYGGRLNLLLILGAFALLSGCAANQPIPPVFNLYRYQRVAVIPFDNSTMDPILGHDAEEEMSGQIVDLGALPVIQAAQVAAYLRTLNASSASVLSNESLRLQLARKFQCELFLMGSADGFEEFLRDAAPERRGDDYGFYTKRKVVVNLSAKLIDPATGSLLWRGKNQGWSYYNTWNPLPVSLADEVLSQLGQFGLSKLGGLGNLAILVKNRILDQGDVEPPSLDDAPSPRLIYPKSHYFNELRQKALAVTVKGIVGDFVGSNNWTPASQGNSPR